MTSFIHYNVCMIFMTKKKILKLIGFAAMLILLAGYFFWKNNYFDRKKVDWVTLHGHVFSIETVTTESAKEKGLGGRKSICGDCGMLFVFNQSGRYAFWMKDMLFALDILWIKDGKIVFIKKNVQPSFAETMAPSENVDQVLEINAGMVDKLGITIGDEISGVIRNLWF